ncbi:hypothetical protein [Terriglobus albidus]|uniref:hypothetical protein n=1 Tax=Terriglobus albidus TaxID=1592106 RepID=UPI00164CFD0A|nr:hypothetical protein [Terriglobus albidus]
MVNSTFEAEMTIAFGARNIELTRTLHRRAVQLSLIVSVTIVAGMMLFGPWFLTHWTHGHVPPSRGLLGILLLVVILFSLWSTSSTLMTSTNQHQKLAECFNQVLEEKGKRGNTPICSADCSRTDQIAQSPRSSSINFPLLESGRSKRPPSILAAIIQASIPCLTHSGIATVRTLPPFPLRSGKTQQPSRISIPPTSASS